MPSAPQKRRWAKGRSADTHNTSTPSRSAARWLKARTLAAHTAVSIDGKMLSRTAAPRWSLSVTSSSSEPVSEYAGAGEPTVGSSPTVWTGVPRRVTSAMDRSVPGALPESHRAAGPADRSASSASEVAHVDEHHQRHGDDDRPQLVALEEVDDVEQWLFEGLRQPPDQGQAAGDADRQQHGQLARVGSAHAGERGDDVAADEERDDHHLGRV